MLCRVILVLCLYSSCQVLSQDLKVKFVDKNNEIVPYATVYFPGNDEGHLVDHTGQFTIREKKYGASQSMIVSCIGYHTDTILLRNVEFGGAENTHVLTSKHYELSGIELNSERIKFKRKKLGRKPNPLGIYQEISSQSLPIEIGTKIRIPSRLVVDSVQLSTNFVTRDSFLVELRFYSITGNEPDSLINQSRITKVFYNTDERKHTFDVSEHRLILTDDVIVTVMGLKYDHNSGCAYIASGFNRDGYFKTISGDWEQHKIVPSMILHTRIYK